MKNNPFESKELPEPESGDVIPVYSGYEIPSFSLPLSFSLSLTISLSPPLFSFSISAVSTSAFCNFKQNSS